MQRSFGISRNLKKCQEGSLGEMSKHLIEGGEMKEECSEIEGGADKRSCVASVENRMLQLQCREGG